MSDTENKEVLKMICGIFSLFDEKNAHIIITSLKMTMMMTIYQVNQGNLAGCYEDLERFYNEMSEDMPIVGPMGLPALKVVVEKYN